MHWKNEAKIESSMTIGQHCVPTSAQMPTDPCEIFKLFMDGDVEDFWRNKLGDTMQLKVIFHLDFMEWK